ncbi:unnamed protein product [Bursaphelenchus xylophilus]|uniref:glutathione transferase n=1 Tax=Bursaphelenchus xylophilus TaxID=6326 RepID=A0A1I7RQI8_BURXY|nr:unnamed protein product [Bursaphelenchus xylophilus]CAG9104654.1 unnamed protein product [Bursaphelenchus xylophilus]
MLHYAGIPFNDRRLSGEEWAKIKFDRKLFPYGTMPVLFVDNDRIAESHVINRYVGRLARLDQSDDPLEAAHLDEIYEVGRTFFDAAFPFILMSLGFISGDKEATLNRIFIPNVEKFFPIVEQFIRPNGWFSDKGLSYVDFFWASVVDMYLPFAEEVLKLHPKSIEHMEKVKGLPQLQEYLRNRP